MATSMRPLGAARGAHRRVPWGSASWRVGELRSVASALVHSVVRRRIAVASSVPSCLWESVWDLASGGSGGPFSPLRVQRRCCRRLG